MTPLNPWHDSCRPDSPMLWTGSRLISVRSPSSRDVALEDIARSLSQINRWAGGARRPLSVAGHCLVALAFAEDAGEPLDVLRAVLMHDAAEAYLGDVPAPVKALCPDFGDVEFRFAGAIWHRFRLAALPPEAVARWDRLALRAERDLLLPACPDWPGIAPPPAPDRPETARALELLKTFSLHRPFPECVAAHFLAAAARLGIA